MATETRARFNKVYVPGMFAFATENFKRYPKTWKEYYSTRKSTRAYEESGNMSGLGYLATKPEGTAYTFDARIQGYIKRWTMEAKALAVRITHEAIEDDQYNVMNQAGRNLGISAASTQALLAARLLMNANNTTYHTAGDAKAICATDHVRFDGGTWSNLAGAAAAPTTATVEAAVKAFESILDNRGKKYDQRAMAIVCGPVHEFTMSKILESTKVAEDANNAKNTLATRRSLKLIIDHEITDGRWFVQGEKDPEVGIIHFDREMPVMRQHGDNDTGDRIFTIYYRDSNECNDPRQIYMTPAT